MLLKIKNEQIEFYHEAKVALERIRMSKSDINNMNLLQGKIVTLYNEFTQKAAGAEDIEELYQLAEEIEALEDEWERLDKIKESNMKLEVDLNWFMDELAKIEKIESYSFREDIFERIIKQGILFADGRIIFDFKFGIIREVKILGIKHINMKAIEKEQRILDIFKEKIGEVTKSEIASMFTDISPANISETLSRLCKAGYLTKVKTGPSTAYILKR